MSDTSMRMHADTHACRQRFNIAPERTNIQPIYIKCTLF